MNTYRGICSSRNDRCSRRAEPLGLQASGAGHAALDLIGAACRDGAAARGVLGWHPSSWDAGGGCAFSEYGSPRLG